MRIPASIQDLKNEAASQAALFSETGWGLAANVWAFTREGKPGPKTSSDQKSTDLRQTVTGFAALKIRGLASKTTVIRYRAVWKAAIEAGIATDVFPGDVIDLPDVDFTDFLRVALNAEDKAAKKPSEKAASESDGGSSGDDAGDEQSTAQGASKADELARLREENEELRRRIDEYEEAADNPDVVTISGTKRQMILLKRAEDAARIGEGEAWLSLRRLVAGARSMAEKDAKGYFQILDAVAQLSSQIPKDEKQAKTA
jgi:hypothetical protein